MILRGGSDRVHIGVEIERSRLGGCDVRHHLRVRTIREIEDKQEMSG